MRKALMVAMALSLSGCSAPPVENRAPRITSLEGVNPCRLIPDEPAKIAGLKQAAPGHHATFQTPTCLFRSAVPGVELVVTPILSVGFERFEPNKRMDGARSRLIDDYRALEMPSSGGCTVVVDVPQGQVLHISYRETTGRQFNPAVMCQMAVQLADIAMTTLVNG